MRSRRNRGPTLIRFIFILFTASFFLSIYIYIYIYEEDKGVVSYNLFLFGVRGAEIKRMSTIYDISADRKSASKTERSQYRETLFVSIVDYS